MSPYLILAFLGAYFLLLIGISYVTGREDNNANFFLGKRQSPWYVVAFGMIGASLSGVTFISIPGWVAASQFSYMQMVLGYLAGYAVIAFVLLPLYYRLNLTSIYTYLEQRFGFWSYKSGATCFLLSRLMGASFRLYLVAIVLQDQVFDKFEMGIPFAATVVLTIALIWVYTFKGGIKTIIWTDTLQTAFMLVAVGIAIWLIGDKLGLGLTGLVSTIADSDYSQVFFTDDWGDKRHFVKQFLTGMFIAIVMTGLDQDMMQKNLSCKNIREGQINIVSMALVLVVVNLLFLSLGALLYLYVDATSFPMPEKTDLLFAQIAMGEGMDAVVGIFFILGLVAAAYSSADSALTALTTSFCVDFLGVEKLEERKQVSTRKMVHIGMSVVLIIVILVFEAINDDNVITQLFVVAGYTYGPLLGMFAFGILLKRSVVDWAVPIICFVSPVLCFLLKSNPKLIGGYEFGFELLILNGVLVFAGLFAVSSSPTRMPQNNT